MNPVPVTLELPGGRARLEPLEARHAPGLLEAGQDDRVWRYLPVPRPRTVEDMNGYITTALERARTGGQVPFAIIDRESGKPAGSTRYLDIQPANRGIEIGYTWLGVAWQRTRVNTECKYLLMRHAFETLGAVRVQLRTDARNQQSRAAILRIGAVYEGCLRRSWVLPDGFIRDTVFFSVLDGEWPLVKVRLESILGIGAPSAGLSAPGAPAPSGAGIGT
jgi:RimJ/RimL family protein N-acetyltransferase